MLPNKKIIRVLFILMVMFTINLNHASASDNPDDPSVNDPAEGVPVDGGISLLLAAGAAYGARRLKRAGGKKSNESFRNWNF